MHLGLLSFHVNLESDVEVETLSIEMLSLGSSFHYFLIKKTVYVYLAVLGLRRCTGHSPVALCRLLTAVAPLVAEHRLQGAQAFVIVACGLASTISIAFVNRFSCSVACRIFPD